MGGAWGALLGAAASVWFGGRRLLAASREQLRRIIREELGGPGRTGPG